MKKALIALSVVLNVSPMVNNNTYTVTVNHVKNASGAEIHSQIIYECLNSFCLEPGEYNVTLEFRISPLRVAASVISGLTALLVCSTAVFLLVRKRQERQQQQKPYQPH
jgi:hypothetical protein